MSIIEKSCAKAGVQLTADTLPQGSRTVKSFQRLIAAMRSTEAEVMDRLSGAEKELNQALRQNLILEEQVHQLEKELLRLRLRERLDGIEALTSADRQHLLAIAPAAGHAA